MAESDKARASGHARAGLLISDNGSIESIGESLQSQRSEESLQNLRSGESIQNLRSGESLQSQRSEESVDQGREEPPQEAEPDTDLGCTKEEEDAIMAELAQQLSPLGAEQPPSVAELEQQLPPEVPGPARLAEPNPDTQAQVTETEGAASCYARDAANVAISKWKHQLHSQSSGRPSNVATAPYTGYR